MSTYLPPIGLMELIERCRSLWDGWNLDQQREVQLPLWTPESSPDTPTLPEES
jgi:hypothetical protein